MKYSVKSLSDNNKESNITFSKPKTAYAIGFVFLAIAAIIGIITGASSLSWSNVSSGFSQGFASSPDARIFAYVRLPRTLASLFCGAALAVSGAVIQRVLANRLASPGVIGVNSGAGLAVTLCAAFGIYGGSLLSFFAFVGAFGTVMLVSLIAQKWGNSHGTLILTGVAVNSLFGAMTDTVITFMPDVGIMSNDFKIGEFSAVTYQTLIPALLIIVAAIIVLMFLSNSLDVLTLGEKSAKSLGMNTALMRTLFLMLASLLAGCAVSVAGLLSFVGLIVPHAVRRLSKGRARHHMLLCAIYGAAFVCFCDTMARSIFSPYEIPVGIIMAFLGAPFFIFILIKGKGGAKP